MMDQVRVGVGVFTIKDEKYILIGRRKCAHGEGTYQLPGGHLEIGESFETTASREKLSNLLDAEDYKYVGVTNDIFEKEKKHYVTIFMKCKVKNDKNLNVMEPHKCEFWKWFTIDEIKNLSPLFIPLKNFLEQNDNNINEILK